MKKVFKIVGICTLLSGLLALALCYIIIPEQTNSAADVVVEYLNKPLGIIGGTTLTLGLVIYIIVKLVYDRYKDRVLSHLNNTEKEFKDYVDSKEQLASDFYDSALKEKEEIKAMLNSFYSQIDIISNELIKVCETMPNAKVNALATEIKNNCNEKKHEIEIKLEEINKEFDTKRNDKVEELENKVKELNSLVERLVSQYEREETTND